MDPVVQVERSPHMISHIDTRRGLMFRRERELKASAALALDLASTITDPARRHLFARRAGDLLACCPETSAERMLLTLG